MKASATRARPFRSILCPVDFSAQSRPALRAAVVIADRFRARITVVYVDDPLLTQAAAVAFDARTLAKNAEADLRRFVERTIGKGIGRRRIAYEIVSGRPADEILRAARRTPADLIVMGTQGLGGPKRLVFGSTTEAVLRGARVPVLAVPPRNR
jgi:nucleotide-binding universal stress UspA family protein